MPAYKESKDDLLKHGYAAARARSAGLKRMVESDAYCIDVLTQGSAPTRALQSVALGFSTTICDIAPQMPFRAATGTKLIASLARRGRRWTYSSSHENEEE